MVSLTQLKKVSELADDGWFSVAPPFESYRIPIGGPTTMINGTGEVIKVYSDGSVVYGKFERE